MVTRTVTAPRLDAAAAVLLEIHGYDQVAGAMKVPHGRHVDLAAAGLLRGHGYEIVATQLRERHRCGGCGRVACSCYATLVRILSTPATVR